MATFRNRVESSLNPFRFLIRAKLYQRREAQLVALETVEKNNARVVDDYQKDNENKYENYPTSLVEENADAPRTLIEENEEAAHTLAEKNEEALHNVMASSVDCKTNELQESDAAPPSFQDDLFHHDHGIMDFYRGTPQRLMPYHVMGLFVLAVFWCSTRRRMSSTTRTKDCCERCVDRSINSLPSEVHVSRRESSTTLPQLSADSLSSSLNSSLSSVDSSSVSSLDTPSRPSKIRSLEFKDLATSTPPKLPSLNPKQEPQSLCRGSWAAEQGNQEVNSSVLVLSPTPERSLDSSSLDMDDYFNSSSRQVRIKERFLSLMSQDDVTGGIMQDEINEKAMEDFFNQRDNIVVEEAMEQVEDDDESNEDCECSMSEDDSSVSSSSSYTSSASSSSISSSSINSLLSEITRDFFAKNSFQQSTTLRGLSSFTTGTEAKLLDQEGDDIFHDALSTIGEEERQAPTHHDVAAEDSLAVSRLLNQESRSLTALQRETEHQEDSVVPVSHGDDIDVDSVTSSEVMSVVEIAPLRRSTTHHVVEDSIVAATSLSKNHDQGSLTAPVLETDLQEDSIAPVSHGNAYDADDSLTSNEITRDFEGVSTSLEDVMSEDFMSCAAISVALSWNTIGHGSCADDHSEATCSIKEHLAPAAALKDIGGFMSARANTMEEAIESFPHSQVVERGLFDESLNISAIGHVQEEIMFMEASSMNTRNAPIIEHYHQDAMSSVTDFSCLSDSSESYDPLGESCSLLVGITDEDFSQLEIVADDQDHESFEEDLSEERVIQEVLTREGLSTGPERSLKHFVEAHVGIDETIPSTISLLVASDKVSARSSRISSMPRNKATRIEKAKKLAKKETEKRVAGEKALLESIGPNPKEKPQNETEQENWWAMNAILEKRLMETLNQSQGTRFT